MELLRIIFKACMNVESDGGLEGKVKRRKMNVQIIEWLVH